MPEEVVHCPLSSICKDIREYSTYPENRRMGLQEILDLIEAVGARADLSSLAHTCLDANGITCWLSSNKKEITDPKIKSALRDTISRS